MVWIQFAICLAVIIVAGTKLAKYGDLIAEKTGLGRVWIGVVLLATITSIPELATGISSVSFVGEPDLMMGDLFGSNLINLLIIAIIDLVHTRGPVLHYLGTGIVLSMGLSLFLIAAGCHIPLPVSKPVIRNPVRSHWSLFNCPFLPVPSSTVHDISLPVRQE